MSVVPARATATATAAAGAFRMNAPRPHAVVLRLELVNHVGASGQVVVVMDWVVGLRADAARARARAKEESERLSLEASRFFVAARCAQWLSLVVRRRVNMSECVCSCERSNWVVCVSLRERARAPLEEGRGEREERERPPPSPFFFKGPRALAPGSPHLPPFPKKTKYFAPPAPRPCCSSSSVVRLLRDSRHRRALSNALSLLTPFPPLPSLPPFPHPTGRASAARPQQAAAPRAGE